MANTLKFGNGQWATKEGSTLAYNDENGNFKPLPFNFERSTSATRVNKEGLIEVVSNNEPRIDFLNDSKGALLLEPSRSNLITYSEAFDNAYWTKNGASITSGFTSPDGTTNAFKLVEDTSTGVHRIYQTSTVTSSTNVSISIYVKYAGTRWVFIRNAENNVGRYFDLVDGVTGGTGGLGIPDNSLMVAMGDGWYKISVSNTNTSAARLELWMTKTEQATFSTPYTGDGTSGVYIYGAQLEEGSYATSYIPTSGSAATRVAESSSQTPPDGVIGQSEGTIFYDGYYGDEPSEVYLFLQENLGNGVSDSIYIQKFGSNSIAMQVYDGNNFQTQLSGGSYVSGQRIKIAVAYKQNDFALYINNVQIGVSSGGLVPNLNGIQIGTYPALSDTHNYIASKGVNNVQLYNTRLSNSELVALTS